MAYNNISGQTLGTSNSVFKDKSDNDLNFRSLSAGTNVTITEEANYLTINSSGGGGGGTALGLDDGLNTYTGGTYPNLTVNVSGVTLDNITVSGASSFGSLSATTFYSGSTDLSTLFGAYLPLAGGDMTGTISSSTVNVLRDDDGDSLIQFGVGGDADNMQITNSNGALDKAFIYMDGIQINVGYAGFGNGQGGILFALTGETGISTFYNDPTEKESFMINSRNNINSTVTLPSTDNSIPVFVSVRGGSALQGIVNSVILGGSLLTADTSNAIFFDNGRYEGTLSANTTGVAIVGINSGFTIEQRHQGYDYTVISSIDNDSGDVTSTNNGHAIPVFIGGRGNIAKQGSIDSVILGGSGNTVNSNAAYAFGYGNTINGETSVAGGKSTVATGETTFAYGNVNNASGAYSVVLGGQNNTSYANSGIIVGGQNHEIAVGGKYGAIIGGTGHTVSDEGSVVIGGYDIVTSIDNTVYMPSTYTTAGQYINTTYISAVTYNVLDTDYFIEVDSSSNNVLVLLPVGVPSTDGQTFIVKDAEGFAAIRPITISGQSGQGIDSTSSYVINTQDGSTHITYSSQYDKWLTH